VTGLRVEVLNKTVVLQPDWATKVPEGKESQIYGFMALSRIAGTQDVLLRQVPHNVIYRARLNEEEGQLCLQDCRPVLSPKGHPITDEGRVVTQVEDPTALGRNNPYFSGRDVMLYSCVYSKLSGDGVIVDLCWIELDNERAEPRVLMAPRHLQQRGFPKTDMVKEGEIYTDEAGHHHLFFEFADGTASHLGVARLDKRGSASWPETLYLAQDDQAEHLSTAGQPFRLRGDGRLILPFNRRRNNEWQFTFGVLEPPMEATKWRMAWVSPDPVIRAPQDVGLGPGDQLIFFGSSCTPLPGGEVEVFGHVNDGKEIWRVIINFVS
jgi:hypothetical protein